jgi:hypothetical protein
VCPVGVLADLAGDDWPQWCWQVVADAGEDDQPGAVDGIGGGAGSADAKDGIFAAVQDERGLAQFAELRAVPGAPTCLLCAPVSRGPLPASRSTHSRAACSSNG